MNPAALIPTPDPLQVPWGWFQLLLVITFFMHVLLMNVMLGTAIIAFVNHLRGGAEDNPLCRQISKQLPFAIAFAVNFGIAPLLFLQVLYGNFMYASSVLMATFWLSIIGLIIVAYYSAYIYNYRYRQIGDGRVLVIGLSASLLLIIGFFLSSNITLMQRPDTWFRYFDHPTGFLLNLGDPTLFPRYLHFVTSAIAVGGLAIALFYEWKRRRGDKSAVQWIRHGCSWFGYATIVNFGIGFWFFGSLPSRIHSLSTLTGTLMVLLIAVGIVTGGLAAIYALQTRVMPTLYLGLATILMMTLARDLVRAAYLHPYFSLSDLNVVPQYSPMILFLIFFVGGLVLIGWMLRFAFRVFAGKEVQS